MKPCKYFSSNFTDCRSSNFQIQRKLVLNTARSYFESQQKMLSSVRFLSPHIFSVKLIHTYFIPTVVVPNIQINIWLADSLVEYPLPNAVTNPGQGQTCFFRGQVYLFYIFLEHFRFKHLRRQLSYVEISAS